MANGKKKEQPQEGLCYLIPLWQYKRGDIQERQVQSRFYRNGRPERKSWAARLLEDERLRIW